MSDIFGRIDRPERLPDEVAKSILAAIARGDLKPGDKIPTEHALSQRFGVARTVVREAISLLKYDGVIHARQGVGAFVAPTAERQSFRISPACFEKRKELVKLLQLRTSVQADAAALAAVNRSDAELVAMQDWYQEIEKSMRQGDDGAELRVDAEASFYSTVTKASGNEYFVEFITMIDGKIMGNLRTVAIKNAKAAEWGEAVLAEHAAVLKAITASDADAARMAAHQHFEHAARRLSSRADFADV